MSAIIRSSEPRKIVRVLACVAAPFDPGEIGELAAVDVIVDGSGARLEALSAMKFDVETGLGNTDGKVCTPVHVTAAVWGRRAPDALAAHDASTASLVFTRNLTGRLRWISLHKAARRVWPGQESYDLEALARWRAWAGPHGPFSHLLVSGAERDAALSAGLLIELLCDPGLRDVAEAAWLDQVERDDPAKSCFGTGDALSAALIASALPAKPLREAPFPFDDPAEWAGIGLEDLKHHARFSEDDYTAEAARAELRRRLEADAATLPEARWLRASPPLPPN